MITVEAPPMVNKENKSRTDADLRLQKIIGQRMRQERNKLGLSITQLLEKIKLQEGVLDRGFTSSGLRQMETGERLMHPNRLKALARFYKKPMAYFMDTVNHDLTWLYEDMDDQPYTGFDLKDKNVPDNARLITEKVRHYDHITDGLYVVTTDLDVKMCVEIKKGLIAESYMLDDGHCPTQMDKAQLHDFLGKFDSVSLVTGFVAKF